MSDNVDLCKWFVGKDFKECTREAEDNSDYCEPHSYVSDYTNERKQNKKYCSSCRKVKCFSDDTKTCGCSKERVDKLNETRKKARKIKLDKQEQLEEKKKQDQEKLMNEQGYIRCKTCDEVYSPESFVGIAKDVTVNCQICRDKQKILDSKRTTRRDWTEEYNKNPELYERKQQYKKDHAEEQRGYEKKSRMLAKLNK
jgi:hypothetical protein